MKPFLQTIEDFNRESFNFGAREGDVADGEPQRLVLSAAKPAVLYVPAGYANGFMNFTQDTIIQFFSTSTLEESKGDDIRFPYDRWNIWEIERR